MEEEDSLCWRMKMRSFLSASAATLLMLAELMLPEQQPLSASMLAVLLWARDTTSWQLSGSSELQSSFTSSLHLLLSLSLPQILLSFFSFFFFNPPTRFPDFSSLSFALFSLFFSFSNLVFLCLMNKINFCF